MEEYKKAIDIDPNNFKSHMGLARMMLANEMLKEATEEARIVIKLNPENKEAHKMIKCYEEILKIQQESNLQSQKYQSYINLLDKLEPQVNNVLNLMSKL